MELHGHKTPAFAAGMQAPLDVMVAGLRWDKASGGSAPAGNDLDLFCVLLAHDRNVLDIVHPGRERNANASVVHTGDCTTGAGSWDDERLFVFLDTLPQSVSSIMIVVASASGDTLASVPNASCHITNHESDEVLLARELTVDRPAHCVATAKRTPAGWRIVADCRDDSHARAMVNLAAVKASSKHGAARGSLGTPGS